MPVYRYLYNQLEKYNPNPTGETKIGTTVKATGWYTDIDCGDEYVWPIYAYRPLDPTNEDNLECEDDVTYMTAEPVISNDNGATWTTISGGQRVRIGVFDINSDMCRAMWKYVVVQGEYTCEGTTKYLKLRKYESYDRGATWTALDEFVQGGVIEYGSRDCGWRADWETDDTLRFWHFDDKDTPAVTCVADTKMYNESEYKFQVGQSGTEMTPNAVKTGETRNEIPYEYKSEDCGYENPNKAVVFDLDYRSTNGKVVVLQTYFPKIPVGGTQQVETSYKLFHPMYAWNDEYGECHNFISGEKINTNMYGWGDIGFNVTHDGIYHVRFLYYGDVNSVTTLVSPFSDTHIYNLKYPISSIFPNFDHWEHPIFGGYDLEFNSNDLYDEFVDWNGAGTKNYLTYICSDFFANAKGQTELGSAFRYSRIREIPEGLFDGMPNLTDINYMFADSCLETVPVGVFAKNKKITHCEYAFADCYLMKESGYENMLDENDTHFTQRSSASLTPDGYTYIDPENAVGMFRQWTHYSMYCGSNIRSNYHHSPMNWKYCPDLWHRTCSLVTYNDGVNQQWYNSQYTLNYFLSYLIIH